MSRPLPAQTAFTDVAADEYYANAVAWAAQNGIVSGIDATTFAPNNAITREQMAAILYRYAQFKGYDVSVKADLSVYTDAAQVSTYATDAMAWANGAQLIYWHQPDYADPGRQRNSCTGCNDSDAFLRKYCKVNHFLVKKRLTQRSASFIRLNC